MPTGTPSGRDNTKLTPKLREAILEDDPQTQKELYQICKEQTIAFLWRSGWSGINNLDDLIEEVFVYVHSEIKKNEIGKPLNIACLIKSQAFKCIAENCDINPNDLRRVLWVSQASKEYGIPITNVNAYRLMTAVNLKKKNTQPIGIIEVYTAIEYWNNRRKRTTLRNS